MNINDYLEKQYPNPPCWALVADVYEAELGLGVQEYRTVNNSIRSIAAAFRLNLYKGEHGFEQVDEPTDYTVVMLSRQPKLGMHHCGIYFDGKVLHALPDGNLYQDVASLRDTYPVIEFWRRP
ncbi:hypothetical protein J2W32_000321 [Variovorax boronicumulans]|uniref:NlpC/P60 domain-containing protein n=1 Tax=Variovorax boronicumulans TaxID=436515 RepID=A0AAW8CSJ9_9BURK|nr:hypothetical protein [Variovorax boronicumulans]MDP9891224.1 hypothetical protein [Variovorax boronicumulans]MDQ0051292.1 hypothetical protein [Variovorax boronicumulans]